MRNKNTTPRAAFNPDRSHDAGCITRVNSVCECNCSKAAELDVERFDEVTGGYDDFDHARAAKRLNADLRAMDATPRGKHTPGPWHMAKKPYSRSKDCPSGWNVRADTAMPGDPPEHVVATAHGTDAYGFSAEANARLIAASPCLLEACERLLDAIDAEYPDGKVGSKTDAAYKAARAAIARATR